MRTNNRMQSHWTETRNFIKKAWPRITEVELEEINGSYDVFLGYLKEYYGNFPLNEAIAREKLKMFYNTLDDVRGYT